VPFNLLLLPLLGGWLFFSFSNVTCYWYTRQSKDHALLAASCAGLICLFLSRCTVVIFASIADHWNWTHILKQYALEWIHFFAPFPYSTTSILAFFLAVMALFATLKWYPVNKACDWLYSHDKLNALEDLIYRCNKSDNAKLQPVILTLKSRQVYIGYIQFAPPLTKRDDIFVVIVPIFSGYRDKDNFRLHIETSYQKELEKLETSGEEQIKFEKIIPIGEIQIASEFEIDVYLRFRHASDQKKENDMEMAG
jgi:hypothetical protein